MVAFRRETRTRVLMFNSPRFIASSRQCSTCDLCDPGLGTIAVAVDAEEHAARLRVVSGFSSRPCNRQVLRQLRAQSSSKVPCPRDAVSFVPICHQRPIHDVLRALLNCWGRSTLRCLVLSQQPRPGGPAPRRATWKWYFPSRSRNPYGAPLGLPFS